MNEWLWLIPVIAAAGGWLAAAVLKQKAIHRLPMLLREFSGSLQGTILSGLSGQSAAGPHYEQIRPFIEEQADSFFRHRLVEAMPMVGMLIGDKTILQMKAVLMKELEELFPVVMEKYLRIAAGDPAGIPDEIRQKIMAVLARPLRRLPIWGMMAGLAIGALQLIYLAIIL